MGCDIHCFAEVRNNGKWEKVGKVFADAYTDVVLTDEPFNGRSYGLFGWLADVRNYSQSPVIAEPRGLPRDLSPEVNEQFEYWEPDAHTYSWLLLSELLAADYEQVIWDRRITRREAQGFYNGAALANEGEGEHMTLRAFLGEGYFEVLEALKALGAPDNVRIVFWFDN